MTFSPGLIYPDISLSSFSRRVNNFVFYSKPSDSHELSKYVVITVKIRFLNTVIHKLFMGRRIQIFHLKKIGPAYTNREPVETVLKRAFECGHRLKVAVEIFPPKKQKTKNLERI